MIIEGKIKKGGINKIPEKEPCRPPDPPGQCFQKCSCGKEHPISAKPESSSNPNNETQKSKIGLTEKEQAIMDHLVDAWNEFIKLPVQHPSDISEYRTATHTLEMLLAMRVVRREYEGWTCDDGVNGRPRNEASHS